MAGTMVYNVNDTATQVLAAKQVKENIFVNLVHKNGYGVTQHEETNVSTLRRPFLYSAISERGERPWKQEYSSHRPHEQQKNVFTKILGSCTSLQVAARMNRCGWMGCPSMWRGQRSVHIEHWQQLAAARFNLVSVLERLRSTR